MKLIVIASSAETKKEAERIVTTLVNERLVACGKWWPITSAYWWQGRFVNGPEYEVLLVTRKELFKRIEKRIKALHSYTVPQLLEIPIERVHEPYRTWVLEMLGNENKR